MHMRGHHVEHPWIYIQNRRIEMLEKLTEEATRKHVKTGSFSIFPGENKVMYDMKICCEFGRCRTE
ncbi:42765_t:CDS:2 [Gigaspora margarita]|uniref:42765_t:CDS:1 n=1 Tax=Gigaspora margarita TaxID=4874 RepID=A0ABM8VVL4_GIGMA|nr:42765_t:CDS:2 [Gigaspora margarita]